ncbi:MAG: geranylgeranylglycerol-phosphate geranylgeranyltransferase [Candidatus Cloacimonadota bacterium]|nr:geranylgeranylglycerol-phosphate geranylgeranyltransferase [Candidatus Cloacimonadota bacterium]
MKFVSYIKIVRPFNFLFVILSVLFGAFWFKGIHQFIPYLASLSAALIASGGYVINDFFDRDIDKINRPERPIPSGIISPLNAKRYAFLLFAGGIVISICIKNSWIILLAIGNSFLLYLYAYRGKKLEFLGNILVAFVTGSTFIYGGFANNNVGNSFFVFGCAFLYTIIRELVKDLEDIEGDKKIGAQTVPIIYGENITLVLLFLSWVFLTILTVLGFHKFYGLPIFILIIVLCDAYLLVNLLILFLKMSKKVAGTSEKLMKIDMLLCLALLWVGQ